MRETFMHHDKHVNVNVSNSHRRLTYMYNIVYCTVHLSVYITDYVCFIINNNYLHSGIFLSKYYFQDTD